MPDTQALPTPHRTRFIVLMVFLLGLSAGLCIAAFAASAFWYECIHAELASERYKACWGATEWLMADPSTRFGEAFRRPE